MNEYKFMHIHVVKANSREEAIEKFTESIHNRTVENYYEALIIKKIEKPKSWFAHAKSQITGK